MNESHFILGDSSKPQPESLHLGILSVTIDLLEQLFQLPEGYKIVTVHYNERTRILNFTLTSEELPEVQEYCELPRLDLLVSVHYLEDVPHEYRKITTEIRQSL